MPGMAARSGRVGGVAGFGIRWGARLYPLEDGCGTEAAGGADAEKGRALAGARQLVGHRRDHPGSGRAEGVTEGEGASVDVETLGVDFTDGLVAAEARVSEPRATQHL